MFRISTSTNAICTINEMNEKTSLRARYHCGPSHLRRITMKSGRRSSRVGLKTAFLLTYNDLLRSLSLWSDFKANNKSLPDDHKFTYNNRTDPCPRQIKNGREETLLMQKREGRHTQYPAEEENKDRVQI